MKNIEILSSDSDSIAKIDVIVDQETLVHIMVDKKGPKESSITTDIESCQEIKKELLALEQRYQDGFLESNSFWSMLVFELGMIGQRHFHTPYVNSLITELMEKIEKEYKGGKHE